MLHRSFKPAKCKTALKLAVSRIKLLKNKREAHIKQLKRELAQLLESGQDQTARIRVEHVVREEKTMAAYDLVEIYCELIAARLPMIESQKNCPIDLKEAIASVIFASPRCSDLPELMDVRKHMTAKYGKEFVSAAVELRPDSGVNRLLVEKLSARAPDGPTKIKILSAIAEEHNVKWEPKSFGESDVKSSQDLLVGPNTFEKATYVEPSQVHIPPVHDEKGTPNLNASLQLKPMHDVSTNSDEQNASVATREAGGNHSTTSGRSNPEIRSSGTGSHEMDFRDSYSENRSAFPVDRQNWNMEFKDAASAAQAAAESAERASMAARAAADLSNRENMTRQYSSGPHNSSGSGLRDEVPQNYVFNKDLSTGSINSTFARSSSGMHNEQNTSREQDNQVGAPDEYYRNNHENVLKRGQSGSLTSSNAFGNDNPFANGSPMANLYSYNNSPEQENSDLHDVSNKKQASRIEADFVTELHRDGDLNTENDDPFGDAWMNRQSIKVSSSHLITPTDDHNNNLNLNGQKMGNKAVGDLFLTDEGNTQRSTMEASYYNNTSVVFDDSESEDDDYEFAVDKKNKGQGSDVFVSSTAINSQDSFANKNAWSHGQVIDEKESSSSSQSHFSVISERLTKSAVSSGKEDLLPVTFDDSDDLGSDSDVNLVESKVSGSFDYGNSDLDESANHGAFGSSSSSYKNVGSDRKSWLPSSVGSATVEEHTKRKVDITSVSEKNFGHDGSPTSGPSSKGRSFMLDLDLKENFHASQSPDTSDDTEPLQESRTESGKELNYGTLKGGFRNKGYRRPPYIKNTSGEGPSSLGDISAQNERLPSVRTSISSGAPAQEKYTREVSRGNGTRGLRAHNASSDSDSNDLVAKSQETITRTHDPRIWNEQSEAKKKSSSRASISYFDDDSDSEDELPKQNSASLARPVSGVSRRTSASSKDASLSKASVTSGTGLGWKSSTTHSYESKSQKASSTMKSSDNWASSQHGSVEHAASKPISQPNRPSHVEIIKSSAGVQPSSSLPKTVIPDSKEVQEASKSSNPEGDTPSEQKANHVHPKLPDYDSFAAHFLSLRKGRQ